MAKGDSRRKKYDNLKRVKNNNFINPIVRSLVMSPGFLLAEGLTTNTNTKNTKSTKTTNNKSKDISIKSDTTTGRKKIFVSKTPSRVKRGLQPKGRFYFKNK